jgi:hypothetical protein
MSDAVIVEPAILSEADDVSHSPFPGARRSPERSQPLPFPSLRWHWGPGSGFPLPRHSVRARRPRALHWQRQSGWY